MTPPTEQPGSDAGRRWWNNKVLLVMVVCALVLAVWGVTQAAGRTSTQAEANPTGASTSEPGATSSVTPSAPAPSAPAPSAPATDAADEPAASESPAPEPAPAAEVPGEPSLSDDAALAAVPQPIAAPVSLDAPAAVETGLEAKVTDISAVQGEAVGIGEIAGPAIKFTIEVTNNTDADVSTNSVAVTLEYGKDATPAGQLSGPGTAEFPPVIAKGETASATYVFNVPVVDRSLVRILLSVDASLPIAAFEGAL